MAVRLRLSVHHKVRESHLQGDDVLCCVFLLVDDDAPVHQDVIEQEELTWLGLPSAGLGEDALPHQHPARHTERLTNRKLS